MSFLERLDALLDGGFTGKIELHCLGGAVKKYTKSETKQLGKPKDE